MYNEKFLNRYIKVKYIQKLAKKNALENRYTGTLTCVRKESVSFTHINTHISNTKTRLFKDI